MRITNKIMQNNSLYNINQNKIKEDKYSTQMATNKKINRASEDPIVAIRALRLRSSVSELTQYYDKNSKDAESWLKVTEDALSTVTDVLTSAISLANKGANKDLTTTDLDAIIKEMTELSDEYYSTGNVDYGGRYVFTGYRTDTPLTFTEKTSQNYTDIKDTFNAADVEDMTHIAGLSKLDANGAGPTTEAGIEQYTVSRIRLSYENIEVTTSANTIPTSTVNTTEDVSSYTSGSYDPVTGTTTISFSRGGTSASTTVYTATDIDSSRYVYSDASYDESGNTLSFELDGETKTISSLTDNGDGTLTGTLTEGTKYLEFTVKEATASFDAASFVDNSDAAATVSDIEYSSGVISFYVSNGNKFQVDVNSLTGTDNGDGTTTYSFEDDDHKVSFTVTAATVNLVKATESGVVDGQDVSLDTNHDAVFSVDENGNVTIDSSIEKGTTSITGATVSEPAVVYREDFTKKASSSVGQTDGQIEDVTVTFRDGSNDISISISNFTSDKSDRTVDAGVTASGVTKTQAGTYTLTYNSDGTASLTSQWTGNPPTRNVINLSVNGAVFSSYKETSIGIMASPDMITGDSTPAEADAVFDKINTYNKNTPGSLAAWMNTDTGEVYLSDGLKDKLSALPNIVNADTIQVTYDKSQFVSGDIRPENLFDCQTVNPYDNTSTIHYNGGTYGHSMTYDLGYAQTIDVNTQANEVFTTDVKRTMDDLNDTLKKLKSVETTISQIKSNIETATDSATKTALNTELDAANKARDFLRDDLQKQMEAKITDLQKALDVANLAVTENGTRSRRLELIQNRLQSQLTTFKTLQSDNEDIDMAETATNLMTAQTVYNASLQATSKISQTSLMDYI